MAGAHLDNSQDFDHPDGGDGNTHPGGQLLHRQTGARQTSCITLPGSETVRIVVGPP